MRLVRRSVERSGLRDGARDGERELGSDSYLTLDGHVSPEKPCHGAADRQPESSAAVLSGSRRIHLAEWLENALELILADADSGVRDAQLQAPFPSLVVDLAQREAR